MPEKIKGSNLERARAAANKAAALGEDINLTDYKSQETEKPKNIDPTGLSDADKERMLATGVMINDTSQRTELSFNWIIPLFITRPGRRREVMAISSRRKIRLVRRLLVESRFCRY
jgi:hypothetical protein